MFNFLRKKQGELKLYAPVKGKIVDITETPDPVFGEKMLGDGVAIEPADGVIVAPCDGEISAIPESKHAIAIKTACGLEVLIHVGLNTVELEGQGFELNMKTGDQVSRGKKMLTFNREYISGQGKPLITPLVITNTDEKVKSIAKFFDPEDGVVMVVQIK